MYFKEHQELFNFVSNNIQTANTVNISAYSFEKKFKHPDQETKETVKKLLIELLGEVIKA